MKLAVIAVGSLKEKYYKEACGEYLKRMTAMQPVEMLEIPEERIADEKDSSQVARALEIEGRHILSRLRAGDSPVALTPDGFMMDSIEFAGMIDTRADLEYKRLVFIIGSSHGLSQDVYHHCIRKLSLGCMTFPHQLTRVMLLEQIYRGQMIAAGRTYHK